MSSTRLFVGNVPETASENDLQSAFSAYGQKISVDLKIKAGPGNDHKKFAFITLSASNHDVESCIKHFSTVGFDGSRLHVTRARESFLERLQRERLEALKKEADKNEPEDLPKHNPVIKLGDKLNPRKRKIESASDNINFHIKPPKPFENQHHFEDFQQPDKIKREEVVLSEADKKKQDADKKRIESIRKKRQEFNQKKMIIKTGLVGIDKVANKRVIFSDGDEDSKPNVLDSNSNKKQKEDNGKSTLFDDEDSDTEVNFDIKKQFEGKKGQKILDLQSRYKSDKRFTLDERFIEDGHTDEEKNEVFDHEDKVDLGNADEKTKQLNILQDVLGVTIKTRNNETDKKNKTKLGMLRFDPTQPEHAKFLAPIEDIKQELTKNLKKKKGKQELEEINKETIETETAKVQVSKEQFYKVSETLKEALEQPAAFSLRSLFGQNVDSEKDKSVQDQEYIPLKKVRETKFKNPLEPSAKNPFVYDSSDSESEEADEVKKVDVVVTPEVKEVKAVWKENLFFSELDSRLIEGLAFFNQTIQTETQKERRELKSVMKKRISNKDRKNQMFQKKIGGRKKSVKKSYRKKS